jgi:hypothetical protein
MAWVAPGHHTPHTQGRTQGTLAIALPPSLFSHPPSPSTIPHRRHQVQDQGGLGGGPHEGHSNGGELQPSKGGPCSYVFTGRHLETGVPARLHGFTCHTAKQLSPPPPLCSAWHSSAGWQLLLQLLRRHGFTFLLLLSLLIHKCRTRLRSRGPSTSSTSSRAPGLAWTTSSTKRRGLGPRDARRLDRQTTTRMRLGVGAWSGYVALLLLLLLLGASLARRVLLGCPVVATLGPEGLCFVHSMLWCRQPKPHGLRTLCRRYNCPCDGGCTRWLVPHVCVASPRVCCPAEQLCWSSCRGRTWRRGCRPQCPAG